LRAARALTRREASDLWPDLNGVYDTNSTFSTDGDESSSFVLGLDASYQVDLWGQIQSRVDAERLRASATHADYHVIALTLSADVARTWYSLIEAHAQLELLNEQIETNRTGQELQEARFALGQVRLPDVLRQQQLVQSTLEQAVIVQSRIEVLEHLLAILEGRPPQDASYEPGRKLPPLPPLPDTGLPSELLARRPDIRREFLALQAADRDLAAAITSQYPRINLTSSLTNAAEHPEDLFREWFFSIGSQLVAPLIDGGQRRAEIDRTSSVVYQRFNEYGQTVLNAYGEVEDSLTREQYLVARIERLDNQTKLASQSSTQLREQYLIRDANYLDVLSAITAEQSLQRQTLSARLELVRTRIALYLALAGSFDPRAPLPASEPPASEPPASAPPAAIELLPAPSPENASDE
jgi:NodT family efflux transporter outer membrane factor (OMF) lipoprotein